MADWCSEKGSALAAVARYPPWKPPQPRLQLLYPARVGQSKITARLHRGVSPSSYHVVGTNANNEGAVSWGRAACIRALKRTPKLSTRYYYIILILCPPSPLPSSVSLQAPPPSVGKPSLSNLAARSIDVSWEPPADYWDALAVTGYQA